MVMEEKIGYSTRQTCVVLTALKQRHPCGTQSEGRGRGELEVLPELSGGTAITRDT